MASNNGQQQQHYQTVQQQQQQGNSSAHHCKECGLYLNSAESLEVHLRYHKENLLNKWATQAATSAPHSTEETNNNTKPQHQIKREFIPNTISAAADSSDSNNMKKSPEYANRSTPETNHANNNNNNTGFGHPPTPQSYHSASSPYQNPENSSFSPGFQNFQIKQERASPIQHFQQNFYSESFFNMDNSQNSNMGYNPDYSIHKMGSQNSAFRYHPYQQQHYERSAQPQVTSSSPAYPPQPTPSPSPKQCDKCGCVCESAAQLIEHLNVAHPPTPAPHAMTAYQNFMFGNTEIKVEEDAQSEILDLDSHKVHQVYSEEEKRQQQQNGELTHNPHSVSAMLNQWPHATQQQTQQQNSPQQKMYVQDQRMYGIPEQKMYPNGMQEKMFQDKLFSPHPVPNDFMQNGVTTTSPENAMNQAPQTYRPFEMAPQPTPPVISSTQVPVGPPQTAPPPSTKSTNWKSNEARRPKTYNCTACNKWFTSSGHLKRHYNTTLHKNAVKSSGQPDPATLPISAHHHPARDQNNREDQSSNSPNDEPKEDPLSLGFERPPSIPGLLQQPPNGPYDRQPAPNIHHPSMGHVGLTNIPGSPPNGEAGPSATANMDSRGLLTLNTTHHHTNSNSPHGFIPPPMMPMENNQFQMYPNGVAPHVTQVTTNNLSTTGEELIQQQHQYGTATNRMVTMNEAQPLPSFAQFQAHRYGLVLSYNGANVNVGGSGPVTAPYSYYSDPYDTPESRALIFRPEDDYKLTVLTVPDPSMEGDPYSPPNNNNHLDLSATDGELKMELKYETPASPEKAHIKRDFEENSSPQISSTVNVKQTSLHRCIDCDKVFNKSCYLTQHNKTFHSGDKPFKCSRCGKRFSCESQYQEHHSKHAGEKPHKCDLCPKQFNHKTDLRRHMCLHTGQKPYACDTCGKGFIRKDHMLKHCDTHIRRPHSKLSSVR
ncbi:hypothetical protein Trydic_g10953 [Trypoxylus dichotomus]